MNGKYSMEKFITELLDVEKKSQNIASELNQARTFVLGALNKGDFSELQQYLSDKTNSFSKYGISVSEMREKATVIARNMSIVNGEMANNDADCHAINSIIQKIAKVKSDAIAAIKRKIIKQRKAIKILAVSAVLLVVVIFNVAQFL